MLQLEGVCAEIGGARVLRYVSMTVPAGGRVALIGRNGAGKTTTLRALMGLAPLREGKVTIDGRDCGAVPAHRRCALGVGYAPEERNLFGSFTVRDNMLLPAQVLGLSSRECQQRLEAVFELLPELRDLSSRRAAGLSGGQGKMVALGRALMVGTRAIILDEPLQGLAPALALRYVDALRRLRAALPEVAILITESSPNLLKSLVERTFVIERGEISAT
ncbi:ATP-binding cassette domain-containing protein [Bradyrhizobium sp. LVM 105]|uniref:ABC transporter ATP-binding protein n=1 Tax=Bradyrhizobium sp. LVM 105 TaxID=2341115 RepID=UPI000F803CC6|nr:ATP-binding cassette domain-containing protein [Bradyrhizobium sp. LVM 105]RTE91328.1 ATP-binding cassette domain-containing protein [Bradyrhizobium sp. LVM 105]